MVVARGAHTTEEPPKPIAIGKRPNIVVMEVSIIGRKRNFPAMTIERQRDIPAARALLVKLTRTSKSLTTIPASATIPYMVAILNGFPIMRSPTIHPIKPKGIANMTIIG